MERFKIAHLTYSYFPLRGGADIYLHNLFQTLKNQGYEQNVYQKYGKNLPSYVHPLPFLPSLRGHDFWLLLFLFTLFAPRFANYDLLIIHYPPYLLPFRWHPRTITISHGVTWDDAPSSRLGRLKKWFAKFAFEKSTSFVANDTFFLREMGLAIAPGTRKFEEILRGRWFIPNCVDTTVFLSSPKERKEVIIVPRNLYFSRGVHLAIEAFARTKNSLPSTHVLIVGGLGQVSYARDLLQRTKGLGLGGRVKFLGHISWDAMRNIYSEAGLCLIPSLYGEGTSLSALEAMASGVATISTDIGGLSDLPTIKCEPTASSLAEKILEVYPHKEEIGEWQRKVVQQEFSLDLWRQAWLKVVKSTLNM